MEGQMERQTEGKTDMDKTISLPLGQGIIMKYENQSCVIQLLTVFFSSITIPNIWPQGYKTFFMLNSIEHEIFPAHKC